MLLGGLVRCGNDSILLVKSLVEVLNEHERERSHGACDCRSEMH